MKRTIYWDKHVSSMSLKNASDNLTRVVRVCVLMQPTLYRPSPFALPPGPFRVIFANWLGFLSPTDSKQHTHTHIYKYPVQMGLFEQFRHTQAHHDVTPPLRLCSCDRQPHSACLCVCTHTEFSSVSMNINHESALNVYFSLAVLKVLCVCAWKEIWKWGKGNRIITFR